MTIHIRKKPKYSQVLTQVGLGQGRGLWLHHPCDPRTLAYVADSCWSSWSRNPSSCLGSTLVSPYDTERITALP